LADEHCGAVILHAPGDAGTIEKDGWNPKDITPPRAVKAGIARTDQDMRLLPTLTLAENVLFAFPGQEGDQPGGRQGVPLVVVCPGEQRV
jgi:ABC-type branched-subunit amino acid transport system ATPase component